MLLHGHADGYAGSRIPAIEQVVPIVHIVDINVVSVIPVISPVFRPGVDRAKPIAVVLETGVSSHDHEREDADFESMVRPKTSAETVIRYEIPVISAALPPGSVVRLPVACAMLLPGALLRMLKLRCAL